MENLCDTIGSYLLASTFFNKMDFSFLGMDFSDNKVDFLSNSNMYSECAVRDKSNEMRMRGLHQLK